MPVKMLRVLFINSATMINDNIFQQVIDSGAQGKEISDIIADAILDALEVQKIDIDAAIFTAKVLKFHFKMLDKNFSALKKTKDYPEFEFIAETKRSTIQDLRKSIKENIDRLRYLGFTYQELKPYVD